MEKLKVDDNRINITKMTAFDNNDNFVTGGYITKCDKSTDGDPVDWYMESVVSWKTPFMHVSPKQNEITLQQNSYIYNQFDALKNTTASQNSSIINGYPSIIDVPSFVDFIIMNELASNPDGYQFSTYFHKDRNGKLRAGPIWDFNLTYGNDLFIYDYDRSKTDIWQYNDGENVGAKFWFNLLNNDPFTYYLSKRWMELTAPNQLLNPASLFSEIYQLVNLIAEAKQREQDRWGTVGDHASEIAKMKTWIQTRINWMSARLNNVQQPNNVTVPALVISKINYKPVAQATFTSNNLEFIEITNNSNAQVNLTGIYFKELGVTYQFPVNSTVEAHEKIFLASDVTAFKQAYGIQAFGGFLRNLSNKSEKLVLADAFGNIIDYVEYHDTLPWPTEANGFGSFLELADLNLDNNLGENWKASSIIMNLAETNYNKTASIYYNRQTSILTIYESVDAINSIEIVDMFGKSVYKQFNLSSNNIDIRYLQAQIYIVKLNYKDGTRANVKLIKN